MIIHIHHHLASPCKWKDKNEKKDTQSQTEEVSLDTRVKHRLHTTKNDTS